jgi:hypothetical protein
MRFRGAVMIIKNVTPFFKAGVLQSLSYGRGNCKKRYLYAGEVKNTVGVTAQKGWSEKIRHIGRVLLDICGAFFLS